MRFLLYYVLVISVCSEDFNLDEEMHGKINQSAQALVLTPLIQSGRIKEAQKAARVNSDQYKGIKSYSGYFTVSEQFNSNMFFWFFPSERDYKNAPVILWLQGGPGASSLLGALLINGAFEVENDMELKLKQTYWSQTHSVIYIDNPVGTGFSYTDGGYAQNLTIVGEHLYKALLQFFQLFPELQGNDFFITGESYGGKYVPAVSYYIMKQNPTAIQKINLKGLAIGNGICDPENQLGFAEHLYQIGLIDTKMKEIIQTKVDEILEYVHMEQWEESYQAVNNLILGESNVKSLFTNLTGFTNYYNILNINDTVADNMEKYVKGTAVRAALHVGNNTFSDGQKVLAALRRIYMQSVAPLLSELLDSYRVLFYNGQFDIVIAYPLTVNFLKKLKFQDAEAYKTAERHIWMIDGDVAGYVKEAGKLTEILIRNSGHMVPLNQPKWAFDMISRFTRNKPFY